MHLHLLLSPVPAALALCCFSISSGGSGTRSSPGDWNDDRVDEKFVSCDYDGFDLFVSSGLRFSIDFQGLSKNRLWGPPPPHNGEPCLHLHIEVIFPLCSSLKGCDPGQVEDDKCSSCVSIVHLVLIVKNYFHIYVN